MGRTARLLSMICVAGLILAALLGSGCTKEKQPKLEPRVKPPAIGNAGAISIGVDLSSPPFAGVDGERQAGFDIDVAAALAERLGLTVSYVDIKPSEAASALAEGKVDAVMSVPLNTAAVSSVALAGSYAVDGPAFFVATDSTASVEPSITLVSLKVPTVGAQRGSEAYWHLRSELGSEAVIPYDSLRQAIEAVDAGEVELVAGDAFVGAYIARDYPSVHYAGQPRLGTPLCVAVSAENAQLEEAVRTALDALATDGVFDALRMKWVGNLEELQFAEESAEATGSL